jgi:hypothetical protein
MPTPGPRRACVSTSSPMSWLWLRRTSRLRQYGSLPPGTWRLLDRSVCPCFEEVRFARDSTLEGTGFEPSVPRQEKWSIPSSSDQTRVGRTLTLGGGAEASPEAETLNSRSRRRHPYFANDLCANRSESTTISGGGPMVRIHFPPAASQQRTVPVVGCDGARPRFTSARNRSRCRCN